MNASLLSNLDKIHTTELGKERIKKNLGLNTDDVVSWCVQKIVSAIKTSSISNKDANSSIYKKKKNWYITVNNCVITVNARSYTIITAHKAKE
jgi:hypothetical protein